jgi:hypothetical protein
MSMETASISQHCKTLRLASIGGQFASQAEEARQKKHSHFRYLEALLQSEVEDRERRSIELRLKNAHLPRMKTLEELDLRSVYATTLLWWALGNDGIGGKFAGCHPSFDNGHRDSSLDQKMNAYRSAMISCSP